MPGARVLRTPTMSSMAPAIAEISMKPMPSSQKSALIAGRVLACSVSGGYMNQPPSGARPKKMRAEEDEAADEIGPEGIGRQARERQVARA